jgi:hypothetical protein
MMNKILYLLSAGVIMLSIFDSFKTKKAPKKR